MKNLSIPLLSVIGLTLLGILIGLITNKISLPFSEPVAIVILVSLILLTINFIIFQHDHQINPSKRRNVLSFIVAGVTTIVVGGLAGLVISEENKLTEQRDQLIKDQTAFNKQRALQLSQLRIGFLPDGSRENPTKDSIITGHLSEKLNNIPVTIENVGHQYVDLMNAIISGEKEVAYLGPLLYLHIIKSHEEIKPILFMPPDKPGQDNYYSYIVARSGSGITSLADVEGKDFIFGDEWSTSGTLYPKYFLRQASVDIEKIRGTYISSHMDVIQQVLQSKNIIIGATSSFAYDDYVAGLKLGEENQIIILNETVARQNPIPPGPIVLRAGIQEYDTLRIKDAYLSINDPFILNTVGTGKITSLTTEEAKGAYKKVSEIADLMGKIL